MALILIIEDEYDLRVGIAEGLRLAGFDVADAEDGNEGYDAILALRPDLVLCDISMPGMRGDTLLHRLRREQPELARMPFVFLTALADRHSILAGQELGADDYLTKPVDLDILVGLIRQRLDQVNRWGSSYAEAAERERHSLLASLGEQARLSFLSGADVLNRLSDAVILLNRTGAPIFINRAAQHLLRQEDGLSLRHGLLSTGNREDMRRLRDALDQMRADAAGDPSRHLRLERPSGRQPYAVRICRLEAFPSPTTVEHEALAALFIADPDSRWRPSETSLCSLYGLTPAEARVAASLAQGLAVDEIAAHHHISRNTVHHQLRAIFRKTATTRQSDLIALLLTGNAVETGIAPDGED